MFTCAVPTYRRNLPQSIAARALHGDLERRRLLITAATAGVVITAGPLAGCIAAGSNTRDAAVAGAADPDLLTRTLRDARALIESYDEAIAALPELAVRLTPLRGDHVAHVAALVKAIGPTPSTRSAFASTPAVGTLPGPEQTSAKAPSPPPRSTPAPRPSDTGPTGSVSAAAHATTVSPTAPTVHPTGRSTGPLTAETALARLRAAEAAAQRAAASACLVAEPMDTPLLGSIAACLATHLEVLV